MAGGSRVGWLLRRLRAMTPAEVLWRVRQAGQARLEARGIGLCSDIEARGASGPAWVERLPTAFDVGPYRDAADRILTGRFRVFALEDAPLGFPPDWHVDPKTGTRVEASFGKAIDYRDGSRVGDVKYLWEINRHLELVTLAQAWHLTREARYANGCAMLLDSWFRSCTYPLGPNWTSSLEHGYRLVNWSIAWHLLGGDRSPLFDGANGQAFRNRWLRSVRQHCHFIDGWVSLYSSANNHLLGECTGLFVGALTWPMWSESARWLQHARRRLDAEFALQTFPDGVNREQAIHYQRSVMDMMLVCSLYAKRAGIPLSPAIGQRLERMTEFLAALCDRNGQVPSIGDSDDAQLVRWDPDPAFEPTLSLLATGALLHDRADWLHAAGAVDPKTRWLLGDEMAEAAETSPSPKTPNADPRRADAGHPSPPRGFPDGGYYVLEAARGTPREIVSVFDCGPLGYPSIAAHGHADALALTLTVAGVPVLIDPGTFAYHTDTRWRNYFRSTFAHNTVCVDGLDQSESGGNFLWLAKAQARCLGSGLDGSVQFVRGEHDGYRRLRDPLVHRRRVRFDPAACRIEVEDELVCAGSHRAKLVWHWGDACMLEPTPTGVLARLPGVRIAMSGPVGLAAPTLLRGVEEPTIGGWRSPAYDVKVPITSTVWDCAVHGTVKLATIVTIEFDG